MGKAQHGTTLGEPVMVFLACSAFFLVTDLVLYVMSVRMLRAPVLPLDVSRTLAAGAAATVVLAVLLLAAGERAERLRASWTAFHVCLLVVVILPLFLARQPEMLKRSLAVPGLWAVYGTGVALVSLWLALPARRPNAKAAFLLAGFVALELTCYMGQALGRRGYAAVAAVAAGGLLVSWLLLDRALAAVARWIPRSKVWHEGALACVLAACWLLAPQAAPKRVEAQFFFPIMLAKVGNVARGFEGVLTQENSIKSWDVEVQEHGHLIEVYLFASGEHDEQTTVQCRLLFRPTGGERDVLLEANLRCPMDGWRTEVVDMDRYAGQKGLLTVTTASVEGGPYHVICSTASYGIRQPDDYSVLLVSLDGLRADHLGCYGYERPTSAWMDEVAAGGARFENCSSQAPWSLPSLFALMTGEFPSVFWADQPMNERPRRYCGPLPTLAAIFRHDGFHTAAITDGGPLKPEWGLFQGFDTFVVTQTPGIEDTYRRAADWLRAHAGDRFFLFVQSSEACLPDPGGLFSAGNGGQQAEAVARYDAGVARADLLVGLLLKELERCGVKDKTLLIITSAHGQDLSELAAGPDGPVGRFGHGLGQALLHVPLILRAPGLLPAGKVVRNRVAAIDVTPTVLALLGIEQPGSPPGRSLKPLIEGAEGSDQETAVYCEATTWGPEQKALVLGRYKIVFVPKPWKDLQEGERHTRSPEDRSAERERLLDLPQIRFYDLENDPQEQDDISGSHADLVARYRAALMLIMDRNRELRAGYKSAVINLE